MKRFLLLVPVLSLTACGLFQAKKKPEKKQENPRAPQLIGRIASVPLDKRFVLVQSYGAATFDSGAILTSRGPEERTANLKVTGEKLGQFLAADVQAGAVEVGDGVYSHHIPKPKTEETPPPTPEKTGRETQPDAEFPALPEPENAGKQ